MGAGKEAWPQERVPPREVFARTRRLGVAWRPLLRPSAQPSQEVFRTNVLMRDRQSVGLLNRPTGNQVVV